jgi:ubiquitin
MLAERGGDIDTSTPAGALAAQALAAADREVMDDLVEASNEDYVPSGKSGPRVSDAGGCPRSVWYREQPPADFVPDVVDQRRAALGTIIHKRAEAVRSRLYPWRLYEFTVTVPGLDRPGRVDEYDPVLGEVTDDKTAGSRKWEMVGADGPTADAWAQGMVYGLALDDMGWPVKTIRIIVINRDTGQEEHFRRDFDPAEARADLDDLIELATMLDLGIVPERTGVGPASFPCSWCVAKSHCWNIEAADAAGRSPESYTLLGPDPDDKVIEWAGVRVIEARKAATDAKKAKDEADALIDGVKAGTYGDVTIGPRSRQMPNYKDSFERLSGFYALPDVHRPSFDEATEVTQRTDRWTEVKAVRAAKRAKKAKAPAGEVTE